MFIDDRVICRVNYFGGDYNFGLKFINYELNQGLIANYKMGLIISVVIKSSNQGHGI